LDSPVTLIEKFDSKPDGSGAEGNIVRGK